MERKPCRNRARGPAPAHGRRAPSLQETALPILPSYSAGHAFSHAAWPSADYRARGVAMRETADNRQSWRWPSAALSAARLCPTPTTGALIPRCLKPLATIATKGLRNRRRCLSTPLLAPASRSTTSYHDRSSPWRSRACNAIPSCYHPLPFAYPLQQPIL